MNTLQVNLLIKENCSGPKRNIDEYLNNIQPIQSYKLKSRLFKEELKQKQCESCKLTEWLGKPIPLELDHIDGNNSNNSLNNLRILCPNCHALTPTYRGKNIKSSCIPVPPLSE